MPTPKNFMRTSSGFKKLLNYDLTEVAAHTAYQKQLDEHDQLTTNGGDLVGVARGRSRDAWIADFASRKRPRNRPRIKPGRNSQRLTSKSATWFWLNCMMQLRTSKTSRRGRPLVSACLTRRHPPSPRSVRFPTICDTPPQPPSSTIFNSKHHEQHISTASQNLAIQASSVISTILCPFNSVARAFPLEKGKNPARPRVVAVVTAVADTQLVANPDYTLGDATIDPTTIGHTLFTQPFGIGQDEMDLGARTHGW